MICDRIKVLKMNFDRKARNQKKFPRARSVIEVDSIQLIVTSSNFKSKIRRTSCYFVKSWRQIGKHTRKIYSCIS